MNTQVMCNQTAAVVAMSIQGNWGSLPPAASSALTALLVFPGSFDEAGALTVVRAVLPDMTLPQLRPVLDALKRARLIDAVRNVYSAAPRFVIPAAARRVLLGSATPTSPTAGSGSGAPSGPGGVTRASQSLPTTPSSKSMAATGPMRRGFALEPLQALPPGRVALPPLSGSTGGGNLGAAVSVLSPGSERGNGGAAVLLSPSGAMSVSTATAAGGAAAAAGAASTAGATVVTSPSAMERTGYTPPAQCPPAAVAAFVAMMVDELVLAGAMYSSNMTLSALTMFDTEKAGIETLLRLGADCVALPTGVRYLQLKVA